MTLYDKLNKEIQVRDKLISKKHEIEKKIEQSSSKIKLIQEEIECLEMNITLKVIKSKGYTITDVREAIEMGVLEDILKK